MQMAGFFFIHRRWEYDQHLLSEMLEYLQKLNHTFQVLFKKILFFIQKHLVILIFNYTKEKFCRF